MDMISELHIFNNLCTNPTETSYYDISLSDSEKVITYLTFYTAQDGKEIRIVGEAFDSYSKDFYGRNSVYLTAGVPYNANSALTIYYQQFKIQQKNATTKQVTN